MSSTIDLNIPEPLPIPDSGVAVWPVVISDLKQQGGCNPDFLARFIEQCELRDKMGRAKYRAPLCVNSGRDVLVDAFQESLDLMVYAMAALFDHANGVTVIGEPCRRNLFDIYDDACRLSSRLFKLIETIREAKAKS